MISTFATDLGFMALATDGRQVHALTFGHPSASRAERDLRSVTSAVAELAACPATEFDAQLQERLERFAAGEPDDFQDVCVATDHLTEFQRRVIAACRKLAWGKTSSYGRLAARVGHPGAARAVGTVMSHNRVPLIVPCHRVLGASGKLGGYSAPQGLAMKRRLLAAEQNEAVFA